TSNLGKVFLLSGAPAAEGTYESDVFDARVFSKWGRPEVRGEGNYELFARTGNVDNPDRNWSAWKKVDMAKAAPVDAPSARFLQWKAVLHAGDPAPRIERVAINYLPKNVAPEVDEVTVSVGARVPSSTRISNTSSDGSVFDPPIPTVSDKQNVAVRWKAHDANDDQLVYTVYYRGDGEKQWKKLREDLVERYANLESDLFPDGGYTVRVVASDLPSHSPAEALTGEKTSDRFEVDNTPPTVEITSARIEGNKLHLAFRASDGFSPISRAEYSIDADDWQTAEPIGQISDYRVESYDLSAAMPTPDRKEPPVTEHTVVVRVVDRYENVGVAKTVIKTPASGTAH
ncbi:MAG TPA: fibronectin type III domain-containing protein, partial [Candidatus Angelobacter sp.]|nr:fibronectin type III domain-containing protein [Candidatus Angelobacter sp.]